MSAPAALLAECRGTERTQVPGRVRDDASAHLPDGDSEAPEYLVEVKSWGLKLPPGPSVFPAAVCLLC